MLYKKIQRLAGTLESITYDALTMTTGKSPDIGRLHLPVQTLHSYDICVQELGLVNRLRKCENIEHVVLLC